MPMQLKDLDKFERQNEISISVYGWEESKTNADGEEVPGYAHVLRVVCEEKEQHVNLLRIGNDDTSHYCWIKNFSRLVGNQYSANEHELAYCRFCLHGFKGVAIEGRCTRLEDAKRRCNEHESRCFVHGGQKTSFPDNPIVKFEAIEKQVEAPFVVYADFESLLEPMPATTGQTTKTEEHVACSYAYYIVSRVPNIQFDLKLYVGTDATEHFLTSLQKDLNKHIMPVIERNEEMIWDDVAQASFDAATECFICRKPLDRENEVISRDHCHFTGQFRGAVHQSCNIKYVVEKERYKLPIFFHNLRGYDAHLIMQAVRQRHGRINVIPNNFERYTSFSIGRLKFLDSMQFLSWSLEGLAEKLNESDFKHVTRFFPDPHKRALMIRKGTYPYDFMKSMAQFDEPQLPTQAEFFNRLNDEPLSDADYEHAQHVWTTFDCQTMRNYHDLYLHADVLLLADVFEKFRYDSMECYGLEPTHYYSLRGLSWDAALKHSDVELELITDIDMYQMVESGIRGGVSMISHRYAEANHPSMGDAYDPSQPTQSLIYLDANSLYPYAMSESLPVDEFEFIDPVDNAIDVTQVADDAEYGYILEVDLHCPPEKHAFFNAFPLAPEKMCVTRDMLSTFQQAHFPPGKGVEKLVPHLGDKKNYVLHYTLLKLYLQLGLELTAVHRIIRFRQAPWLQSYMSLNIDMRKEAARNGDKARVATTKLAMNAVFGKTMENVRNHVNIELLTSKKFAKKRFAKPNFKSSKRFHDELIGVQLTQTNISLNRPIQVGFSVLEKSKNKMGDFLYHKWLPHFPKSTLLFTDTDSLTLAVEHNDIYTEMAMFKEEFDFSEYPRDHPLFDETNRKVVGKFKDELHGACMTKFVGLRPKLYSFEYIDNEGVTRCKNTAKGVKKSVKNNKLSFTDYERCLREMCVKSVEMKSIRSEKHRIYTYNINKIGLSAYDDKRYICDDGVSTLSHGHVSIPTL